MSLQADLRPSPAGPISCSDTKGGILIAWFRRTVPDFFHSFAATPEPLSLLILGVVLFALSHALRARGIRIRETVLDGRYRSLIASREDEAGGHGLENA